MKDIDFTFGIITNADNGVNIDLKKSVESINKLNIPNYEIIIIGNAGILLNDINIKLNNKIRVIDFNEKIKNMWITKKKNLITQNAMYDNVVYLHDYISFLPDWYEGFKLFGDDFKACMTKILNNDDVRYRDWLLFPWHHCYSKDFVKGSKELWEFANIQNNESMLPYDESNFSRWQYFSGAYWVAKKEVMLEFPLDENLIWGHGEDCIWSAQFTGKYQFSMNPNSTVKLLKWKQDAFGIMRSECHQKALNYLKK